ncbi:MAG: hypothetical protein IPM84_24015 [Anaerolineae bacterium]|nr:hypothetical protein [Anaerolineae bacterium]
MAEFRATIRVWVIVVLVACLLTQGCGPGVVQTSYASGLPSAGVPQPDSQWDEPKGWHIEPVGQLDVAEKIVDGGDRSRPHQSSVIEVYQDQTYLVAPHDSEQSDDLQPAAVCTVTSNVDSGAGTLRTCLQNAVAGATVLFSPSAFPPSTPGTIHLSSELPRIRVNNLTIDGSDAGVVIDGSGLGGQPVGLRVDGANGVVIRGLQIVGFSWGVVLQGPATALSAETGQSAMGRWGKKSPQQQPSCWHRIAGSVQPTTRFKELDWHQLDRSGSNGNETGVFMVLGTSNNVLGGSLTPGFAMEHVTLLAAILHRA